MAEEENVQEDAEEELQVEIVFDGEQPTEDLDAYLAVEATATIKDGKEVVGYKKAKGFFPFGKDLTDACGKYTDEVVFSNYRSQAKIKLQSLMRSWVLGGKEVSDLLSTWKPGIQMERTPVDPIVAAENKFDQLDADAQAAFIEKLLAKQKG